MIEPGSPERTEGERGGARPDADVLPLHPDEVDLAAFDDLPDLVDRRRLLLQLVFGVHLDDPTPVFDPGNEP